MKRQELLNKLANFILKIQLPHPIRVAFDGVDGAGKTFLANEMQEKLQSLGKTIIRASIDGFHNPAEIRRRQGSLSPNGYFSESFNLQSLAEVLLEPLAEHQKNAHLQYKTQVFDYRIDKPVIQDFKIAKGNEILLFDGVFCQRPEIKDYWDLIIFVHSDFEITVERAIERDCLEDASNTRMKYNKRYVPGQKLYLSTCKAKENADIIVNNNDFENPSLMINSRSRLNNDL